ncbi:sulfatase-like hydrolase/transferase [Oceaniglobus indicus]|uniref:sulfatase-like hydrolase/transferase n=1 Tax=Oceaniglobus indicus TaxID=2047749 RepID=UPI001F4EFD12|nr:sulfatase-like hydrolase/transferase [Oceaniglobus indicus]
MRSRPIWRIATLILATLLLYLALALPNTPAAMVAGTFIRLPLELPVLIALLLAVAALPRLSRVLRVVLSVGLTAIVLLKLGDFITFQTFSRPFNPIIDTFMFPAGMNLLTGTLGRPMALAVAVAAILAVLALAVLFFAAMTRWSRPVPPVAVRRWAGLFAVVFAVIAIADAGRWLRIWDVPQNPVGNAATTRLAVLHAQRSGIAARKLAEYRKAADQDPFADATGLFDLLAGRDVLVVFIESYGRTSFDNPLYRPTHVPTLRSAEHDVAATGLAMRSGWLTSPIAGGQSWLAHGTFASGLRTGDQARYGAMLASSRQTLFHLANAAGYRTAAVMPAITLPWPEGPMIGFQRILPAADLGYAGEPFNWITMPDQYTLSAWPDLLGEDPRPDFIQIALISSHAPWVPVPRMVDWADVGDGRIFDQWATSGDPPKVVWRDRDRVRDQYRQAIDYALQATFSFVTRRAAATGEDAPLVIVLGDHQPAPFVSQIESRDVPVHLIGPPRVIDRLDGWAFTDGLVPDDSTPVWPMESFRDRFVSAFSSGLAASGGT